MDGIVKQRIYESGGNSIDTNLGTCFESVGRNDPLRGIERRYDVAPRPVANLGRVVYSTGDRHFVFRAGV